MPRGSRLKTRRLGQPIFLPAKSDPGAISPLRNLYNLEQLKFMHNIVHIARGIKMFPGEHFTNRTYVPAGTLTPYRARL
jgi:hypothetical protein